MIIKSLLGLLCISSLMVAIAIPPSRAFAAEFSVRMDNMIAQQSAAASPKFALLVGINKYLPSPVLPPEKQVKPLGGCENDVDDMRGVLTKLYNFPDDADHIVTLKSAEATHQRIIDEFKRHLIGNAQKYKGQKPTIVFYFSGHGSRFADTNGDEGDGWDETLVPYDRNLKGDIIDDQVDELFEILRKDTTNITFILDSCHSGTATRAVDLVPREAPPLESTASRNLPPATGQTKDQGNAILARKINGYVTLSGCLPAQLSYEYTYATPKRELRTNGIMTYHLVQALRLRPKSTYKEIGDIVRRAVEDRFSFQSPQVEGNLNREIFEGADPNARNYIGIKAVDKKAGTITIDAGKAQGLKEGTFIAVYAKRARRLQGPTDKLADAEIIKDGLEHFVSVARLQKNAKPVTTDDLVIILTPSFGSGRLRVALDTSAKAGGPAMGVAKEIQRLIENYPDTKDRRNPLIEVAVAVARPLDQPAKAEWSAAVVRDTFRRYKQDVTKPLPPGKEVAGLSDTDEVYYITTREGNPTYDFFVKADDPSAPIKIIEALEKRARQVNVSAISNSGSSLTDKVRLSLLKVTVDPDKRTETVNAEISTTSEGIQTLRIPERFRFRITNESDQKIFLTLIAINPSGSIEIVSTPEDFGGEILPNVTVKSPRLLTGPPAGKQGFKLMVTTRKVDFSFLEQPAITRGKDIGAIVDPFARLVGQAYYGGTRDAGKDNDQGFDDWTTVDVNLIVNN